MPFVRSRRWSVRSRDDMDKSYLKLFDYRQLQIRSSNFRSKYYYIQKMLMNKIYNTFTIFSSEMRSRSKI